MCDYARIINFCITIIIIVIIIINKIFRISGPWTVMTVLPSGNDVSLLSFMLSLDKYRACEKIPYGILLMTFCSMFIDCNKTQNELFISLLQPQWVNWTHTNQRRVFTANHLKCNSKTERHYNHVQLTAYKKPWQPLNKATYNNIYCKNSNTTHTLI